MKKAAAFFHDNKGLIAFLCVTVLWAFEVALLRDTAGAHISDIQAFLKAAGLSALMVFVMIRCGMARRFGNVVMAMMYGSLLMLCLQYFGTTYSQYAHDVPGHVDYIKILLNTHALPPPYGWQTQQPPLYYIVAAVLFSVGDMLGMADPLYAVRLFSLLLYVGFLVISLFTLERYFSKGVWLTLASAIVLFWPSGFTYGGQISNTLPIFFLHAAVLYLLIRWNETKHARYLIYALCIAFFTFMIKGAAIIALGATGVMCLLALYQKQVRLRELLTWRVVACAVVSLGVNFGRTLYYRAALGKDVKWLMNIDRDDKTFLRFVTGNEPYNYIYFDFASFIKNPYIWSLPKGGDLFWNFFLTTLLYDEWNWHMRLVQCGLSVLLVAILVYVIYFIIKLTFTAIKPFIPLLAMLFCMIGALMAARIDMPWQPQCHARYIYGIIVIFAILFTKAVQGLWREGRVVPAGIGMVAGVLFSLLSMVLVWNHQTIVSLLAL